VARFVEVQAAMCLRNLSLRDPDDVIPFACMVEVDLKERLSAREAQHPWPGLMSVLEQAGVIFRIKNSSHLDFISKNEARCQVGIEEAQRTRSITRPTPAELCTAPLGRLPHVSVGDTPRTLNRTLDPPAPFSPSILFIVHR
jgi:hypothetical protein